MWEHTSWWCIAAARWPRLGTSPGGLNERIAMPAPFLPVHFPGSDHRFSTTSSRWPASGPRPGSTDLFRDNSAYRIGPREPRRVTKQLQLAYHAVHLVHPSLTENSIIGDEVFPVIVHIPVRCPRNERIQTAAFVGSGALSFTAIKKHKDSRGSKQPDICSSA